VANGTADGDDVGAMDGVVDGITLGDMVGARVVGATVGLELFVGAAIRRQAGQFGLRWFTYRHSLFFTYRSHLVLSDRRNASLLHSAREGPRRRRT
jgi:hypothetical protein